MTEELDKRIIATGEGYDFWLLGEDVYRVLTEDRNKLDVYGLPSARRWECSISHWDRYHHSVYDWAIDV